MILGIQSDIVHATVTADVKSLFDRPGALRSNAAAKCERDHSDQKSSEYIPIAQEILPVYLRIRLIPRGLAGFRRGRPEPPTFFRCWKLWLHMPQACPSWLFSQL